MTIEQRRVTPAAPPTTEASLEHLNPDGTPAALDDKDHDNNKHSMSCLTIRRFSHVLSLMASPVLDDTGIWSQWRPAPPLAWSHPRTTLLYWNISAAIGYVFFLGCSVSFYPQVVSNFKHQSTIGLSRDFCVLNVLGFACYMACNVSFFGDNLRGLPQAAWAGCRNHCAE
jgi:hypothetical protein